MLFFVITDIDTDALLKKDLVTLDEALKSANSAVLLAINAISILISVSMCSLLFLDNQCSCHGSSNLFINGTFSGDAPEIY